MIAKLLLTSGLLAGLLYTLSQSAISRALRIVLYGVIAAGIYFVWLPDHSTYIAHLLGIGRGTDLIIYVWILLSFMISLNLHLKVKRNLALVTQLTRHLAVMHPYQTPENQPAMDSSHSSPVGDASFGQAVNRRS